MVACTPFGHETNWFFREFTVRGDVAWHERHIAPPALFLTRKFSEVVSTF
jgi:hypothetical protein